MVVQLIEHIAQSLCAFFVGMNQDGLEVNGQAVSGMKWKLNNVYTVIIHNNRFGEFSLIITSRPIRRRRARPSRAPKHRKFR